MACGAPTAPADDRPPDQVRFITAVFCDVAGSTELAGTLSPDVWGAILARYFAAATDIMVAAGGRVEKFIGDAVVAVFGADLVREDDAIRAVRAAATLRDQIRADAGPLRASRGLDFAVRIAVASGRAALAAGRDSSFAIGAVLNRAARLQSAGAVGDVVVDARTWLLVRGMTPTTALGAVTAKGFPGGVRAWRIDAEPGDAGTSAATVAVDAAPSVVADSPTHPQFVNRTGILADLVTHLHAGLSGTGGAVAVVEGEAGIGKSRLLDQCWRRLVATAEPPPRRLLIRCTADGNHLGLRHLFALDIAVLATAGMAAAPTAGTILASRPLAEVHWQIRAHLADAARDRPLLLVVENLQWAAPPLLDFLRALAGAPPPGCALALTVRTPSGPMPFPGPVHRVRVPPLAEPDCQRLVEVTGEDVQAHAGTDLLAELIAVSRGNPLYLTQMLTLVAESDGLADVFPPSAEAVIGARVDRLPPAARRLLGAVGGFGVTATVADLAAAASALGVPVGGGALTSLVEHRFVMAGEGTLTCLVPTAADVAYRRLPLADRAAMHDRIVATLAARVEREPAIVELVAHHAAIAHHAWRQCAPCSDAERQAARTARAALRDAARFAILHSAIPLAMRHLTAAKDVATDDQSDTVDIAAVQAYALLVAGEPGAAEAVAEAALLGLGPSASGAAAADLMLTLTLTRAMTTGVRDPAPLARARVLARRSGEPAVMSRVWLFEAIDACAVGDYAAAQHALTSSAGYARRAPNCLSAADTYGNLALCLALGDEPAAAALRTCEQLHHEVGGALAIGAAIGCPMAHLLHMLGRRVEAAAALDAAYAACDRIGHRPGVAGASVFRALLAERDGDLRSAADHLAVAARLFEEIGLIDTARTAWLRHDLAVSLDAGERAPRPGRRPDPPAGTGWYDTVLGLQVSCVRRGDPGPLREALRLLDGVRGGGAVAVPLLGCLRIAQLLGDTALAAECRVRVGTVSRAKGDVLLAAYSRDTN